MNDKDLISIIVPVYNVEKYLEKCITSILNQTYKNLQIILVDDGSQDKSGQICDKYKLQDNRIEVIHKKNGGLSDARNIGIEKARGKYIGFVDSDDYISKTMYEDMYKIIQEREGDVCISNLYIVNENKEILKNIDNGIEEYNKIQILREILLDKNIQSYAWNKLYKKSLFKNIRYPIGKKYEDIGTTFYILEKCKKILVIGKPEYYYINRQGSIVNNINEQTILDYIDIISERYDYVKDKYKQLEKYNKYYLAKTLITAYNDISNFEKISKKLNNKINNLYNKVKMITEENKIIDLFDEKQKLQLNEILYKQKIKK